MIAMLVRRCCWAGGSAAAAAGQRFASSSSAASAAAAAVVAAGRPRNASTAAAAAVAAAASQQQQLHVPGKGRLLFTSESVTEGHPDKLCDCVSDAVLDACLAQDPSSKVACEAAVKGDFLLLFGEVTTRADVDYESVARAAARAAGYAGNGSGFDADRAEVKVLLTQQAPEIAQSVHGSGARPLSELGAGDQGIIFGYATDETPSCMPLTHELASRLAQRLAAVRKDGTCPWLRPDGKTQVTVEYAKDPVSGALAPVRVADLVISAQHAPDAAPEFVRAELARHVVAPVVPQQLLEGGEGGGPPARVLLNAGGSFVEGGPAADAGLTGRKIIVDTYGGWGAHGGGAFSGKDPSKVDRSAAYAARQAAKSVVAARLARRCLIQLAYVIGRPQPLAVFVETYGTGAAPDEDIAAAVARAFDFRPGAIIEALRLQDAAASARGRYRLTAAYGHFGRSGGGGSSGGGEGGGRSDVFTWEDVRPL